MKISAFILMYGFLAASFVVTASPVVVSTSTAAFAPLTQLLLIGGGVHSPQMISRFASVAGGARARILVITWATELPDQESSQMVSEFNAVAPGVAVKEAPRRPLNESTRNMFIAALQGATGVFFTGGDQTKIMAVVADPLVRQALQKFYAEGHVVGGTSAGTAIMSPVMFTGHDDDLAPGLGLLPGTLLDTHFLVRGRLPRLLSALQHVPRLLGLGIDQDNAIWVTGNHHVEIFGATHLTAVVTDSSGHEQTHNFSSGQNFDIPCY